ncbi:MAG: hypothetical protein QXY61_02035 [Candidatus Anstonellales archaeon]
MNGSRLKTAVEKYVVLPARELDPKTGLLCDVLRAGNRELWIKGVAETEFFKEMTPKGLTIDKEGYTKLHVAGKTELEEFRVNGFFQKNSCIIAVLTNMSNEIVFGTLNEVTRRFGKDTKYTTWEFIPLDKTTGQISIGGTLFDYEIR